MSTGRTGKVVAGVVGLLAVLMLQLALSIRQESITWDEDDHLYAGYMSWTTGDFGLNPEHPPLVKMLAALPLLPMQLKMPVLQNRNFKHEAFLGGKEFVFQNDADTMLFRARMAASLLTVLMAWLVFAAAREMFGTTAGFIALGLLVFDPNLLAHGALVTTDAGLSCFLLATVYAFYRYVKQPSLERVLLVGLAAGLALASKHTGILVFPTLLLLAICEWTLRRRERRGGPAGRGDGHDAVRLALALAVVTALSLTLLWGAYGFRYAARPAGLQLNPPSAEYIQQLARPHEAKLLATVARFHLLPESYIYGLADVRMIADFYSSYLFGVTYPHGVWFYFPAAIAIKSTLPFLLLLGIAIWAIAAGRFRPWREIWFLAVPAAFYLAVAMSSHMNIGVRHILPVYAFLTTLIGGAAAALVRQNRRWLYVIATLLVFQAVTSLQVFPDYIAYSNELWGGPKNTWKLLSDSNADWGQQLKAAKKYLDARGVKECWFAYFAEGVVDTSYYGIPCKPLPTPDAMWVGEKFYDTPVAIDGTVLISGSSLSGYEFGPGTLNPYEQFKTIRPTAVIQHGLFVFDGHFEIPRAAAIGYVQRARDLLGAQQLPEALLDAQAAVGLAPDSVGANAVMGDVLKAMKQTDEAQQAYKRALELAQSVHPEFQVGWVEGLRKKVAGTARLGSE